MTTIHITTSMGIGADIAVTSALVWLVYLILVESKLLNENSKYPELHGYILIISGLAFVGGVLWEVWA